MSGIVRTFVKIHILFLPIDSFSLPPFILYWSTRSLPFLSCFNEKQFDWIPIFFSFLKREILGFVSLPIVPFKPYIFTSHCHIHTQTQRKKEREREKGDKCRERERDTHIHTHTHTHVSHSARSILLLRKFSRFNSVIVAVGVVNTIVKKVIPTHFHRPTFQGFFSIRIIFSVLLYKFKNWTFETNMYTVFVMHKAVFRNYPFIINIIFFFLKITSLNNPFFPSVF